ncbi:MAG TPA: protein kinase, partial [Sandaracinaceae bacterium]
KQVALKVMGADFVSNRDWVQRFFREGIAASKVRHPGVVEVFDAGEHEGAPWMAMELLVGESLRDRLERRGHLRVEELLPIARQVLGALAAVHAVGIVHRDLKPDNIFLERTPEGERAKVLDFGIAKEAHAVTPLTATGTIVGTAHYLAPEQARDSSSVDARTDLYAFGVILFECLSGQTPYEARTVPELIAKMYTEPPRSLTQLAPHVPAAIARVVHACLARDPDARPASAAALLEALSAAEQPGAATGAHVAAAAPKATWPAASAAPSGGRAHTGPVSAPWATSVLPDAAAPPAPSAPWAPPATNELSAPPRRAPSWPWIVAAVIVVALGGLGLLAAVLIFGAFAAVTQVAQRGAGEGFTAAFEMTLWDAMHAPMIADADGDGREDLIGTVLSISGSGDGDTSFAAFDGATGRQLWRSESLGSPESRTHSRSAIAEGTLLYANASGELYGYAIRTGRPSWRVALGERVSRFCRAEPGAALVETADERRTRVALADGSTRPAESGACDPLPNDALPWSMGSPTWTRWEDLRHHHPELESMRPSASFRDPRTGRIVALGQRRRGTGIPMVALIEPGGGWQQDVPGVSPLSAEADDPAAAAIDDTHVFLAYTMTGDAPARLTSIALAGGRREWDVELGASHFDPRAVVPGRELVAVLRGGALVVLERATGRRRFVIGR